MRRTINISLDGKDLQMIDTYCVAHNLTRSKFLIQNALDKIIADRMATGFYELNKIMKEVSGKRFLTKEQENMIKEVVKMLGVDTDGKQD